MLDHPTKEHGVEAMFNSIAHRYDALNHIFSFGIDKLWRRRLVRRALKNNPSQILDVATGTGDVAIQLIRKRKTANVVGVDIAEYMLAKAKIKVCSLGLQDRINFIKASSEELPLESEVFQAVTVSFGVRNFADPLKGLKEIYRVLSPGGSLVVLEFTTPKSILIKALYSIYFTRIIPWVGRIVSGHKYAYTYLPNSVEAFKERDDFVSLLTEAGFSEAHFSVQTFGIAAIYQARK